MKELGRAGERGFSGGGGVIVKRERDGRRGQPAGNIGLFELPCPSWSCERRRVMDGGGGARSIFAAGNEDLTPPGLPEGCVGAGIAGECCTEKRAAAICCVDGGGRREDLCMPFLSFVSFPGVS